jgi:hypothetical protein
LVWATLFHAQGNDMNYASDIPHHSKDCARTDAYQLVFTDCHGTNNSCLTREVTEFRWTPGVGISVGLTVTANDPLGLQRQALLDGTNSLELWYNNSVVATQNISGHRWAVSLESDYACIVPKLKYTCSF